MAGESSFDVVSEFDDMEMRNALDQVRREVQQRYDFKGATFELTQAKTELVLHHRRRVPGQGDPGPDRVEGRQARPVAQDLRLGQDRAVRRQQGRQHITLRRGLDEDLARKLSKLIRDEFPKVEAADPGRRPACLRQEQGRSSAGYRPAEGAR